MTESRMDRLEAVTAALAEALERGDWDSAERLIAQRTAALEACANHSRETIEPQRFEPIEQQTAELLQRLKQVQVEIRSQLRDLHRENILVRAYLAPEP